MDEVGIDSKTKNVLVKISEKYFRPAEVDTLLGPFFLKTTELNWYASFRWSFARRRILSFNARSFGENDHPLDPHYFSNISEKKTNIIIEKTFESNQRAC